MSAPKTPQAPLTPEQLAQKKVDAIIGFRIHFIVYVGVNALLIFINLAILAGVGRPPGVSFMGYLWCIYPLIGWGIGLVIHYIVMRRFTEERFAKWRDAQLRRFMEQSAQNK
jgi:hypothetical protein